LSVCTLNAIAASASAYPLSLLVHVRVHSLPAAPALFIFLLAFSTKLPSLAAGCVAARHRCCCATACVYSRLHFIPRAPWYLPFVTWTCSSILTTSCTLYASLPFPLYYICYHPYLPVPNIPSPILCRTPLAFLRLHATAGRGVRRHRRHLDVVGMTRARACLRGFPAAQHNARTIHTTLRAARSALAFAPPRPPSVAAPHLYTPCAPPTRFTCHYGAALHSALAPCGTISTVLVPQLLLMHAAIWTTMPSV